MKLMTRETYMYFTLQVNPTSKQAYQVVCDMVHHMFVSIDICVTDAIFTLLGNPHQRNSGDRRQWYFACIQHYTMDSINLAFFAFLINDAKSQRKQKKTMYKQIHPIRHCIPTLITHGGCQKHGKHIRHATRLQLLVYMYFIVLTMF